MADFVQVMKDWRRLCETIQSENQEKQQSSWCKGCPLQGYCIIDTDIKDSTVNVFTIISKQIETWAAEHQVVYPTWGAWLSKTYGKPSSILLSKEIPTDIAEKLGIEPKKNIQ